MRPFPGRISENYYYTYSVVQRYCGRHLYTRDTENIIGHKEKTCKKKKKIKSYSIGPAHGGGVAFHLTYLYY